MKKGKLFLNSLQARILFFFTVFILILSVATTFMSVIKSLEVASDIFSREGIMVAEKTSAMIDGDKFEALAGSLDDKDPFYEQTRLSLLKIHTDASVRYLYTIAPGGETGYHYVIDASGEKGAAGFSPMGAKINPRDYGPAFAKIWKTHTRQHSSLEKSDWGYLVSIFEPIKNSRGNMVGIIGLDFDAQNLYDAVRSQVIEQIVLGILFTIGGIVVMIVFMRLIFVRIVQISAVLESISQNKKGISTKIAVKGNDEIDRMAVLFNQTLSRISGMIALIKDQTINLSNAGHELSENMIQTAAAVTEITGNIQGIKDQVINQSTSVTETNSTMEQVVENINRLNDQVEAQTESVSQSSSAIEEMLANIQNVTNTLIKNTENVERLTSASDMGRNSLEEVSRDIQGIASESEGLLEINSVMENIASQTNLLSMNAAIEAAHAGEVGKGFAVVAGEIRKLAESSSRQSKTISDVLKKIKQSIDKITKSTGTVMSKFQDIDAEVRIVSQQEANIRTAMEEQSVGSKQILEAIGRLQETTRQVQEGSAQMLKGSKDVIREGKNLTAATGKISTGINEIASGADYIDSAVGRVHRLSDTNTEHIDTLANEVEKFKLERTLEYVWDNSLSVENKEIDTQHRELLAAMNKLIRVCTEGGDNKVDFKACIEFLCGYVVKHFADEEVLQQSYGYPDYPNHKKIHETLTKTAGELAAKWLAMDPTETLVKDIREQLGEVIVNHIRTQDTKLGAFIRSKKV